MNDVASDRRIVSHSETFVIVAIEARRISGMFSLTRSKMMILTVLGYSIYDTIIIFDRVRENIPLMRRASMATIANVSLWETIRRSLATSFITLLPVAALFLYGGATLKDFAFALGVGIASGAYSSIFIAAPLLCMLKEREPEYARRKGEVVTKRDLEEAMEESEEELAQRACSGARTGCDGRRPCSAVDGPAASTAAAKREQRRQRRRARPHGRAR